MCAANCAGVEVTGSAPSRARRSRQNGEVSYACRASSSIWRARAAAILIAHLRHRFAAAHTTQIVEHERHRAALEARLEVDPVRRLRDVDLDVPAIGRDARGDGFDVADYTGASGAVTATITDLTAVAAGSLTVNGTDIGALTAVGTINQRVSQVVNAINDVSVTTGVNASFNTATGQIESIQSIELRPDVDGRLVEILVREGAVVTAGTPLFKVDDVELTAQVARAQADRDLAEQALARTNQLLSEKAAAQADVERAEASARSARAGLELLQVRLDRTVVRAPWSGVAGARFVSLGDYVSQNTRLITLQTVNPQRASFQVPERYAERLKLGQKVSVKVAALSAREFIGTVDFVDPRVQLPGRTITVKAVVPNPTRVLQAGMFLEARLETTRRTKAVVVPEEAVLPLPSGNVIWVIIGEQPERRQVELGVREPGQVEILKGIEAGELVVVGGAERLTPQSKVVVSGRAPTTTP